MRKRIAWGRGTCLRGKGKKGKSEDGKKMGSKGEAGSEIWV
jgi:hypothetical protein